MVNVHIVKFTILTTYKCTVQWHQVHWQRCATIPTVWSQNFFIALNGNPAPGERSPIPLLRPLPSPRNHSPLPVAVDEPVLYVAHKWTRTPCSLL